MLSPSEFVPIKGYGLTDETHMSGCSKKGDENRVDR
jgi:hypothetical protein